MFNLTQQDSLNLMTVIYMMKIDQQRDLGLVLQSVVGNVGSLAAKEELQRLIVKELVPIVVVRIVREGTAGTQHTSVQLSK